MVFSLQILGRARGTSSRHGLVATVLVLSGLSSLAACGQKGPLFLPVPPRLVQAGAVVTPAVTPPTLPASAAP